MRQIVEEPIPPPQSICPDYPEELAAIVMRLLQRDPSRRYPTAEALRVDLTGFLSQIGRPHGKREMARFLRSLFTPKDAYEAGEPSADGVDGPDGSGVNRDGDIETLEYQGLAPAAPVRGPALDFDLTTESSLPPERPGEPRVDSKEEAFLTRCDNPLLDGGDEGPLTPLPRDPDRTNLLALPGQHSGGMTTHMLGDGSTYPRRLALPSHGLTGGADGGEGGKKALAEGPAADGPGANFRSETAAISPRSRRRRAQSGGGASAGTAVAAQAATAAGPGRTAQKTAWWRIAVFSSLLLVGLLLAYYIAQR
jgi:hypothetical protein